MNKRTVELYTQALDFAYNKIGKEHAGKGFFEAAVAGTFAELIVRECAQLARDTNLEDVEGGDSAVLRAAKLQILEHFGVEE